MEKRAEKKGMSRRSFLKMAGAAGIASSTIGFPAVLRGAAPKEILVGVMHPLTGLPAIEGTAMTQAVLLAADMKNAAGGIKSMGGAKLKLIVMDTEAKAKVAEAAAEKLIREGCVALLGSFNSPVTIVTTQVAEKYGIPHLITIAVAQEIVERGLKYTFRVQPSTGQMTEWTCKYARELSNRYKLDLKTVTLFHESTFGTSVAIQANKYLPQHGFQIIGDVVYTISAPDLTTEITKVKALNADLILDIGLITDGLLKIRTYIDLKVSPRGGIIGIANGLYSNPLLIKEYGKYAEGIMDGNYWYNPRSALTQKVIAEYNRRFEKVKFQSHCAPSFDAVLVLIDALERTGTTEGVKLRDAIAKTSLKEHISTGPAIEFESNGQNRNAPVTLQQIQGRNIRVILPDDYADAKPVYPVPKWEDKA